MSRKKILIVDDSETIVLFEKLILGSGYEILTSKNGRLGVEKAVKEKPDLILMDIMMPEMDGVESLKAIRSHPETRTIPVIMVTTKSEQARVEVCYQLGCNDYLTKPIDKVELLSKVEKQLNRTPQQS